LKGNERKTVENRTSVSKVDGNRGGGREKYKVLKSENKSQKNIS
jgi:hypothetical protein